jgi:hypothetical protein
MPEVPVFSDKAKEPELSSLFTVLGTSAELWKKVEQLLTEEPGNISFEWKHYGKNSGWTLKVLSKKRNLFFLLPRHGFIKLAFVFGERAVKEILESSFPDALKTTLSESRAYAEGRGLHFEIRSESDLEIFRKLLSVKIKYGS